MNNVNIEILENIGLTKNQALVYLSLLKLGSATAQSIMKESELHKSRIYDSLEKLQQKGLAGSVVKDFKKYFQAVPPEKLMNYLDEKRHRLKEELPKLKELESMKKEEINASIYKDKEGLKSIFSEMLKEGKDFYVLSAKGKIIDELKYYIPNFDRERKKKGMKYVCLWDSKKIMKKAISKRDNIIGKVLQKGYSSNTVVHISGDKVAIVLWKEKYPTGFMIDNKDVADSFRKWFNLIYKKSKS